MPIGSGTNLSNQEFSVTLPIASSLNFYAYKIGIRAAQKCMNEQSDPRGLV